MAVKDTTIIPGQGWVFYSEVDTAPFDLKGFDSADPTKNITGWTWLGSTSKENLTQIEKDGGDVSVLDTWDTPAMRSNKAETNWTVTVNSVSITPEMLQLAFPGGKLSKGTYHVPAKETSAEKALLLVIKDAVQGYVGIYFPKGALSIGSAPSLNADSFMEVPLVMTALTSGKTGNRMDWILPESLAGGAGVAPGIGG
ncbi:hypothetical protein HHJ78_02545 [Mobiluncus mulieris]|uniref:Uncharacterized protein n=2 Tax=Mobiluncus mulieris TaxID=2052 RepID=A0A7Y0U036_9ACTO|nr:hypothetical protein [Mobiluncus mulieris]MCU9995408.1 hypothetical protein [Mobiluncus mulieris]NMW64434.1 hypothetical protein [Mobiluncus mulieris]